MAKITEQDRAEIIKQYASGRSAREIAKSLHVSHTAISKILNEIKSCHEEEKVATKVAKQDNRAIAKLFEDKVMASLERDIDKTSPLDRIKIVERLRFLYGDNDSEKTKLQEVVEGMNDIKDTIVKNGGGYESLKALLQNKFSLCDKQLKVLDKANKRWNILYGATRSGKTHVSYYLALKHIFEHYNHKILFVGKTTSTIDRNVFDKMRDIFGEEHIGKLIDKKEIYIFGKRCYVVGANDDRAITKIQGAGLGYAYLDELTTYPENFFQMLKSRLDEDKACCDATCNPESPSHFVKQHIDKTEEKDLYAEHFSIYDNPFLKPDFVQSLESEYRGTIYFDKWILGNWVKAEGLVFPLFSRRKHYLTPQEYSSIFGKNRLTAVIFGCDGANTNDSTAVIPLAIMSNGQAVTLEMFYHNPKINGQLSNEQLVPLIMQYLEELNQKYRLRESGANFYTVVDCAAADLHLSLAYHLPDWYNVRKYTKKDIMQTTDVVNNAFARGVLCVLNFGGYYNYYRKEFITGENQLVVDLELMTWDKNNEKYDPSVPNDCADAFRYAVNTFYANPENIWETPSQNERFKEIVNE